LRDAGSPEVYSLDLKPPETLGLQPLADTGASHRFVFQRLAKRNEENGALRLCVR